MCPQNLTCIYANDIRVSLWITTPNVKTCSIGPLAPRTFLSPKLTGSRPRIHAPGHTEADTCTLADDLILSIHTAEQRPNFIPNGTPRTQLGAHHDLRVL